MVHDPKQMNGRTPPQESGQIIPILLHLKGIGGLGGVKILVTSLAVHDRLFVPDRQIPFRHQRDHVAGLTKNRPLASSIDYRHVKKTATMAEWRFVSMKRLNRLAHLTVNCRICDGREGNRPEPGCGIIPRSPHCNSQQYRSEPDQ